MKYLFVSFIALFFTLQTFGQQEYFIYLQTDNNQPFYIRASNNVYSSTSSGYLILSKLPDSVTSITVGFAKNVFPEQLFNIPVSHKDGGYMLRNLGDKGWGLQNLQTLAIIMNSNPREEKKSPEIAGIKKTDAFSLLLANAVNDTAVLYAVSKPPKPAPPAAIAIVEEKKKDTTAITKQGLPQKDSNALVKNSPAPKKDSLLPSNPYVEAKNKTVSESGRNTIADTASSAKKNGNPIAITGNKLKNNTVKNKPTDKGATKAGKDTIIMATNNPPVTDKDIAQNKKERKDTIIFLQGKAAETSKPVVKNVTIQKDKKPLAGTKKDSLQLAKHDQVKNSTIADTVTKKDTAAALVKTEISKPKEEKPDEPVTVATKRQRPLINKAAELLTDTSYVAVFVDESNDRFDTIRISVPFNEAELAHVRQDKPPAKEIKLPDAITPAKITKDSSPVAIAENRSVPVKKDTAAADKTIKDTTRAIAQQTFPAAVKSDTVATALPDTAKAMKTSTKPPLLVNSDCKEIALDADIDKLRIKMLVVASDDDRITVAKKLFRQKCFSVKQVKALSELFKSDEGKYKWFDAVYPYVSDSSNFSSLAELLKNDYYLNRFKAMLRN